MQKQGKKALLAYSNSVTKSWPSFIGTVYYFSNNAAFRLRNVRNEHDYGHFVSVFRKRRAFSFWMMSFSHFVRQLYSSCVDTAQKVFNARRLEDNFTKLYPLKCFRPQIRISNPVRQAFKYFSNHNFRFSIYLCCERRENDY